MTNSKLFKTISIITIIVFSMMIFDLTLYGNDQQGRDIVQEGIERYKNAYFEEAVALLTKALELNLDKATEIQASLYLALTSMALEEEEEATKYLKKILKLDHSFVLDSGEFSPEFVNLFDRIKANYPIIYNFNVSPKTFYPYQGEKPSIEFSISKSDLVSIDISSGNLSLLNEKKYSDSSSLQKYEWEWSDLLMDKNLINVSLVPDINKNEYDFFKEIILETVLPAGLIFRDGNFLVQGKDFLPEIKEITQRAWGKSLLGLGLIAGGSVLLLIAQLGADAEVGWNVFPAIIGGCLIPVGIFTIALGAFTKIGKKTVPDEANIKKNKGLRSQIEAQKKKISVTQKEKK